MTPTLPLRSARPSPPSRPDEAAHPGGSPIAHAPPPSQLGQVIHDAKTMNNTVLALGKAYKIIIGNQEGLQSNFEQVRTRVERLETGAGKMMDLLLNLKVDVKRVEEEVARVRATTAANTAPPPLSVLALQTAFQPFLTCANIGCHR